MKEYVEGSHTGGKGRMEAVTGTVESVNLNHKQIGLSADENFCWILRKRTDSGNDVITFFYKSLQIHAYLNLDLVGIGS